MLKNCKYLIIFIFCINVSYGSEYFKWSGNLYKNIKQYNKIHSKFFKEVCTPGTEFKYYKLLKEYRGQGNYLPLLGNDIDREAIKANLGLFAKKIKFIKGIEKKLTKQKRLPNFKLITQDIEKTIHELLELKKAYNSEINVDKKLKTIKESDKLLRVLEKQFDTLVSNLFFLKSFNYPNDHLKNRFNYEKVKDGTSLKDQKAANRIFFYRKIVEDGAYDPNHSRPDLYTRSTLDTLKLTIVKEKSFISENVRHDIEWILRVVKNILNRGYKTQLSRIAEWKERTIEASKFYHEIIKQKNRKKAKALVKEKNEATHKLKEFSYSKQAQTYSFWMKQDRLWRALFSLETILYNEVGVIDGPDALERRDVAHVVMNRVLDPFYSSLDSDQPIMKYLKNSDKELNDQKWLGTLFRIGEFSFTYHYIPSVVKIFCPDMSRRGKQIRDKNLKIALKAMKDPRENFKAFRYFSRVSMLGKIDMSSVWDDYIALPEKPGFEVLNQEKLRRLYHADKYQFLYTFKDDRGVSFDVIEINDNTYSMKWTRGRPQFYKYRDPHLFKYFSKK